MRNDVRASSAISNGNTFHVQGEQVLHEQSSTPTLVVIILEVVWKVLTFER